MHITQQYILIKIYVYISSRLNVTINVTYLARGQTLFHRTLPAPSEGPKYLSPLRNLLTRLLSMTKNIVFQNV